VVAKEVVVGWESSGTERKKQINNHTTRATLDHKLALSHQEISHPQA